MENQVEKLKQQQESYELFGIYYNSEELFLETIPTKIDIDLNIKISNTLEVSVEFLANNKKFNEFKIASMPQRHIDISNYINAFIPNFIMLGAQEDIQWRFIINDLIFTCNAVDYISFNEIFSAFIKANTTIPKEFNISLTITRTNNISNRKRVINQDRYQNLNGVRDKNIESPQEYFAKLCNPGIIEGTVRFDYKYKGLNKFAGLIKHSIYSKQDKQTTVFLLEYLYGKKISKSSTLKKIHNTLWSEPYNDFGIKDVSKMDKLYSCFASKYITTRNVYENLKKEGYKPKTDLARWKKVLQLESSSQAQNFGI